MTVTQVENLTLEEICDKYLWIRKILSLDLDYEKAKEYLHLSVNQLKADESIISDHAYYTKICDALAKVLIIAVDRLDYSVIFKTWLTAYETVI